MTLTHVKMWTKDGWTPITAKKAVEIFPEKRVHADSGLFMCDLCMQYVMLTEGEINERHFRHSSSEEDKNCIERSKLGLYKPLEIDYCKKTLPLKMVVEKNNLKFYIGFLPIKNLKKDRLESETLNIKSVGLKDINITYKMTNIDMEKTSYLYVGDYPSESYRITMTTTNKYVRNLWGQEVEALPKKELCLI